MENLSKMVTNAIRNPGGVTKLWSFSLSDPTMGRREREDMCVFVYVCVECMRV